MKIKTFCVLTITSVSVWTNSQAQQLYKCASSFQDKPCDTDVQKKYSALTGSFSKEQVTTSADSQCAEQGLNAVSVIQARMASETQESLNSKIDVKPIGRQERIKEKELIASVFAKKGNATEIRGAIESDCMERKIASKNRIAAVLQNSSSNSYSSSISSRFEMNAARAAADAARRSR